MRHPFVLLAFLAAQPAYAQVSNPSGSAAPDLSGYAKTSDVSAAISTATAPLATQSALSSVAANIPTAAVVVPGMEVVGGAPGTPGTYRTGNAVQPRITRSVAFSTGSDGTAPVTWTAMPTVPLVFPIPLVATGAVQAPACYPVAGSITTTGATIKCFTTQSVVVSILGATVAPVISAGAGVTGSVLAIPPS